MSRLVAALCVLAVASAAAQQPPKPPAPGVPVFVDPAKPAPVEKISPTTYRIGSIMVDTAAKTLTVPGTVNDVPTLEFVATTTNGPKGYESALTLDTNAVTFNAGLLVLGFDPARSKPSKMQFDKAAPDGDPAELTISWAEGGRTRTEPIEELLFDQRAKRTLPRGPWVYTGSTMYDDGNRRIFLAEQDGVLIGFMHGPQALIDNPRMDALDGYGSFVVNPQLGLKPGMSVTLTVKALPRTK